MNTSITIEQARARRKHFGSRNAAPFHTMSHDSKYVTQASVDQRQPKVCMITADQPVTAKVLVSA